MADKTTVMSRVITREKRVLNEFDTKIDNEEKMEKVVLSRENGDQSDYSTMSFRCECDDRACDEIIVISIEEYQRVHRPTRQFIVVPDHVQLDLEKVITILGNYVVVDKFLAHRASS